MCSPFQRLRQGARAPASVKRMYAERARRAGDLEDAHSLLTAALNLAGSLRTNAVRCESEH
eukprot:6198208-Pleurochrysis_carterae.AAC.3